MLCQSKFRKNWVLLVILNNKVVHELQFLFDKEKTSVDVYKYSKTLFSMITPDVENYIRSKAIPIKNVILCGLEVFLRS